MSLMFPIIQFAESIIHLDKSLLWVIQEYGIWAYLILFLIIFCETGLVITPFLPGDSLLFVAGALAATGSLNIALLIAVLLCAAILGDSINYTIGALIGSKAFNEKSRFLKKEHLEKTRNFYVKYGAKTIIIGRFLPIVRTFAPFVAGIGSMHYQKFLVYNILGAIFWVIFFVLGGYYFGTIPVIRKNFTLAMLGIIVLSFMPTVYEYIKCRQEKKEKKNLTQHSAP